MNKALTQLETLTQAFLLKGFLASLLFFILLTSIALGAQDQYKPYLHKASVPEHPKIKLYGSYQTNLFPGAGTYSYGLEVPPGTNGLAPSLSLSYNSQSMKGRPSFLGAGWSLTQSYIYRDVNFTSLNASDDEFKLILNGAAYDLVFVPEDGFYHTETETFARIQNLSNASNTLGQYWLATLKDGTQLRFGYNPDSELTSNTGKNYTLRWSLDQVQDTHSNSIFYTYLEDPYAEDIGSAYLSSITYNNDQKRKVEFSYESSARSDRRRVYEQGILLEESRRLTDISILFNSTLVRRYHLGYSYLNAENSLSSLFNLTYYGNDNISKLHTITFGYHTPTSSYSNSSSYNTSASFQDNEGVDFGVRLADLNNDGLIDLIQGRESPNENRTFLNNRSGWKQTPIFELPAKFVDSMNRDLGVRLEDVNSDGFADLIQGYPSLRRAWLSVNGSSLALDSTWVPPLDFADSSGVDQGVQFVDVNGDGRVDIIKAKAGSSKEAYLNNESGWGSAPSYWQPPVNFTKSDGSDNGARLADFNGDGLPDILVGYNFGTLTRTAYLNNGSGWTEATYWAPPDAFTTTSRPDNGIRLIDLNGDGLIDILQDYANGTTIARDAWINNGSGWVVSSEWQSPEPFTVNGKNVGRRIGDINGDGFGDIIVGNSALTYTLVRNTTLPYILKNITNEIGGFTYLSYSPSTIFNNSGDDGLSDLGFNVWVVRSAVSDNGLTSNTTALGLFGILSNTSYSYQGGLYDHNESEFRGFAKVNETFSADNSTIVHYFHQSKKLKGKEFKTEIYDKSTNLYLRTESNYNFTSASNSTIYLAQLLSSATHTFDGQSTPRTTNVSYAYDPYNNPLSITQYGDTSILGDEKYQNYTYAINTSTWILDKVSWSVLFDQNHNKLRETKYFYDGKEYGGAPTKGDLTKVEQWLDTGGGNPTTRYEYDSSGNVIEVIDPLGRMTRTEFGVQDITHTFPERITNALGHKTDFVYDFGTGNLLSQTKNGITAYFFYDAAGRIIKEVQPYDSFDFPTKSYTYSFDGIAPEIEKISQRTTANNTFDTYFIFDGLGSLIQLQTPAEDGQQVVKNIYYDGLSRVKEEQNPYFDNFSTTISTPSNLANKTRYTYDALSRPTLNINPDGTAKRITFAKGEVNDYDENNNRHTYLLDAYGRIIAVTEYNRDYYLNENEIYNTTYYYNSADELVGIKDHLGNSINFTHDSLARKTTLLHPDLGRWQYEYDNVGNLLRRTNSKGDEVKTSYDGLNRVIQKNTTHQTISFLYDRQYQGTIDNVTYASTLLSFGNHSIVYEYDERLRIIREIVHEGGASEVTGMAYDSMDRLLQALLPNGDDLDYYYGAQGKLDKIRGYINQTHYNPFGNPLNRTYFNAKATQFDYYSDNARIRQIKTDTIQALNYSYDNVGNIISINDSVDNRSYRMSYDNLDRLTNVTIADFSWVYHYDALGRVLKIVRNFTETTSFKYGSGPVHGPGKVITTSSGVDVYRESDFNTSNKTKIVQFYLVNEKNSSLINVNWTGEFGDGNSIDSNVLFNLSKNENVLVIVEHNYSRGGNYLINLTGRTSNSYDYEAMNMIFGAIANGISILRQNASLAVSEFSAQNTINQLSVNWTWNCTNGVSSSVPFNMSQNEDILIVMEHNYSMSSPNLSCSIFSADGNQSSSTVLFFEGPKITNYNSTLLDQNTILVKFDISNHFSALDVNWNITSGSQIYRSASPISLTQLQTQSISQEVNFTNGGTKTITLSIGSGNFTDTYTENYYIEWLTLNEFYTTVKNATARVFDFIIRNDNLGNTSATWNVSDPVIQNATNLNANDTLIVVIEEDYGQGDKQVSIKVFNGTIQDDRLLDVFKIRQISIESFQTLHQGDRVAVVSSIVKNNIRPLNLSWSLNNTQNRLSSSQNIELSNSEQAIVVIESSYDEAGVYPLTFGINSSSFNDNATGVAVS